MDATHTPSLDEESAGSGESAPLGTLERGLFLLGLFTAERPEWNLRELREQSQLAKATVRRLMLTLERLGWVEQDDASGAYMLGPRILQSLYAKTSASMLVSEARPHLEDLALTTTESALLTVWGHDGPLTLDLVTTPRHFKPFTSVGMVMPGMATADAQILTAFAPEAAWGARFATLLQNSDGLTEDARDAMYEKWRHVRSVGIAYDTEQWKQGVCAIAAPVFDAAGHILASVSVVMPSERASAAELEANATALRKTAAALSQTHLTASAPTPAPGR